MPTRLGSGIGWLRLRLRPVDSLRQHALLLQAGRSLAGAYELYLNGRLVQCQGVLAADPARVRPLGSRPEPLEVPNADSADLVLAVRLAPWQSPLSLRVGQTPLFSLRPWGGAQLRHTVKV